MVLAAKLDYTKKHIRLFFKPSSTSSDNIPYLDSSEDFLSETFAHELSHIFGSTDKYTCSDVKPYSGECEYAIKNGIACILDLPNIGDDIMCHKKAVFEKYADPSKGGVWSFTQETYMSSLIVTEPTAKEIGWYNADGDDILEVNDPCPFNKANNC